MKVETHQSQPTIVIHMVTHRLIRTNSKQSKRHDLYSSNDYIVRQTINNNNKQALLPNRKRKKS